jgi:hypothetical protein
VFPASLKDNAAKMNDRTKHKVKGQKSHQANAPRQTRNDNEQPRQKRKGEVLTAVSRHSKKDKRQHLATKKIKNEIRKLVYNKS